MTRKCNNAGLQCIRKDVNSAYCTTEALSGWDGEILGKSREEYAVTPAEPGEATLGTALFCFMAVLPGSAEEALMNAAKERWASIFSCNSSKVYESSPAEFVSIGTWNSFVNTKAFVSVWEQVLRDGMYKSYDWTVKVDPDAVFMPYRLQYHLAQLRAPLGKPLYLKNCYVDFGFLGAIEIVNQLALINYFDNYQDCHLTMGDHSGEDGFFKGCLDAIGVGYMTDASILKTPHETVPCGDGSRVAFHPHKDVNDWIACYNTASR